MTIVLNNIYDALEADLIDEEQALYLIYTHNKIDYPIDGQKLLKLTKLKYITSNRLGRKLLVEDDVKADLKGTIKARYDTKISGEVAAKLMRLLAEKDPETGKMKLPGTDDTVKHTAKAYLSGEELIAYHYIIFLFMFPTYGDVNKRWEKHFTGQEYKGARLRVRSKSTATAFKKIAKSKDMGVFLYGTYLFIQSCIRENKTYIKTIKNYMREYREWYDMAEEAIKKAKSIDNLFNKKAVSKEGRLNVGL